jgi:hypothetical protein
VELVGTLVAVFSETHVDPIDAQVFREPGVERLVKVADKVAQVRRAAS